ncbi:MAG: biotin--[acetyl-CoA-carboxylase] ligase [Arachnia sp.]
MPDLPCRDAILDLLSQPTMWGPIGVVDVTGSTNADLAAMARSGAAEGTVLVAGEQTSGRGRRDRSWASPPGSSVAISVLLCPQVPAASWGWLSLLAGYAVAESIRGLSDRPERVGLKWPNDVLVDGNKVCGILAELVGTKAGPAAVVGIGINLIQAGHELPVPSATSLRLAGIPSDPNRVVAAVLTTLQAEYRRWVSQPAGFRARYEAACTSLGAELRIIVDDGEVAGIGRGVDVDGRLVISTVGGPRAFAVGDVVHARLTGMPHR